VKLGLFLPTESSVDLARIRTIAQRAEALGYESLWVSEAWGADAISILGALAAVTERVQVGTAIVNVFSRSPALLAQTAATLDALTTGRFVLGLGTSGHQVVQGWHGVPFEQPGQRMREVIEITRLALKRQPVRYEGSVFTLNQGLKLMLHPLRADVPIYLATLTPQGLRLTSELADGWMPTMFSPEQMDRFVPLLEEGAARSGRDLKGLAIAPLVPVAVADDARTGRDMVRPWAALYIGGMGSRERNYYNRTVAGYGFEAEARRIQDLYLHGQKIEAAGAIPDALLDAVTITGPPAKIRERLAAHQAAGVGTLLARIHAGDHKAELAAIETLAAAAA
jgi:F420-dependent oxidoreductase-like protein